MPDESTSSTSEPIANLDEALAEIGRLNNEIARLERQLLTHPSRAERTRMLYLIHEGELRGTEPGPESRP